MMRQADFTRLRISTTSHHGHIGDGMVWRTKRPPGHQRLMQPHLACYAVYAGSLKCFIQRKRRKNRRHAFGHHRFTRPGRPHHDYVVPACSSYLQCTFHIFLSLHIREIGIKSITSFLKFTYYVYQGGCRDV